jgi:hypothetical protein
VVDKVSLLDKLYKVVLEVDKELQMEGKVLKLEAMDKELGCMEAKILQVVQYFKEWLDLKV